MSTCPKCGAASVNAEWRALLAPEHPADWPVYRCGSCFDPSGFCNCEAITCLRLQLAQEKAKNEKLERRLKTYEAAQERDCTAIDALQQIEMDENRQSDYSRRTRKMP